MGYAETGRSATRDRTSRCSRSWRGPRAQLSPTIRGRAWRMLCQNASTVWPERVRPEASTIVPEMISGTRKPSSSKSVSTAEDRRLGVERVEDRLDQEEIRAALDQRAGRRPVGGLELLEGDVARRRIGHVGRDRGGPVRRSQGSCDVARPARLGRLGRVGGGPGQRRSGSVQLGDGLDIEAVVGLGDDRGGERVRGDDVRAGREVGRVDRAHHVGLGQAQEVAVAADVPGVIAEALPAPVGLAQVLLLEHRAHRPVEDQDPFREEPRQPARRASASRPAAPAVTERLRLPRDGVPGSVGRARRTARSARSWA